MRLHSNTVTTTEWQETLSCEPPKISSLKQKSYLSRGIVWCPQMALTETRPEYHPLLHLGMYIYNHREVSTLTQMHRISSTASSPISPKKTNEKDQHPLDDECIRIFGCFYKPRTTEDAARRPKSMPWNFTQSVGSPLTISRFERHFASKGKDHFQYLERFDGWVINKLVAKILLNHTCTAWTQTRQSARRQPLHREKRA